MPSEEAARVAFRKWAVSLDARLDLEVCIDSGEAMELAWNAALAYAASIKPSVSADDSYVNDKNVVELKQPVPDDLVELLDKAIDAMHDKHTDVMHPSCKRAAKYIYAARRIAAIQPQLTQGREVKLNKAASLIQNAASAMGVTLATPHGTASENAWQFAAQAFDAFPHQQVTGLLSEDEAVEIMEEEMYDGMELTSFCRAAYRALQAAMNKGE